MIEKINQDLKDAMKAKDAFALEVIRLLKTDVKNSEIEIKRELKPDEILTIIQKSIKSKEQAIELYRQGNRQDLVEKAEKEIVFLNNYLPEKLSDEEIDSAIIEAIKLTQAQSMKDMGKVMKCLKESVGSRADASVLSLKVKSKLS
ncbi:MAG: GatB/YqeY domain-containing protein [Candidatus Cloacimonetes bacterium]|nr:GatB/YqeY domain-containing protein [Candidatus Cloacimonadota bacterium]